MRLSSNVTRASAIALAAAFTFALALISPGARAQTAPDQTKTSEAKPSVPPEPETTETFFLKYAFQVNDLNDIQSDLRNVLVRAKVYGVSFNNALTVKGTAEDLETARKLIALLDQPRKLYRLTYTITDINDGKRGEPRHFVLVAVTGNRSTLKVGSRVPLVTGSYNGQSANTQVQYADVGLSIEATVTGSSDGLNLRTKVEETNPEADKSATAVPDPVIRQTILDEATVLEQGKPQVLGSVEFDGPSHRQEIEVVAEPVR